MAPGSARRFAEVPPQPGSPQLGARPGDQEALIQGRQALCVLYNAPHNPPPRLVWSQVRVTAQTDMRENTALLPQLSPNIRKEGDSWQSFQRGAQRSYLHGRSWRQTVAGPTFPCLRLIPLVLWTHLCAARSGHRSPPVFTSNPLLYTGLPLQQPPSLLPLPALLCGLLHLLLSASRHSPRWDVRCLSFVPRETPTFALGGICQRRWDPGQ
ncbi:hypothetical protein PAL_GLEAN10013177 [Pteropus alecto]|uniref:Uncharacterized protein n=1 Tax=Pteropus alecto TaxID=9402 RepID=L5KEF7_PTEAL|nr:hypothetical protein PAL_GLEAN10013177 [Pteropus alecto]